MTQSFWQKIFNRIKSSDASRPIAIRIPESQVSGSRESKPFVKDKNYFTVQVNELFLHSKREWWNLYDPLVFVTTEFLYNKKKHTIPFLVGPALYKKSAEQVPQGMIFKNTHATGIYPYRGGNFSLSIVLCRLKVQDFSRDFLQFVEKTAEAVGFSTVLESYTKLSKVILDGVDSLFGRKETEPLVGLRTEFDPDTDLATPTGYYVLIDTPESSLTKEHLWVKEDQLLFGDRLETAQPFRDSNYVLYRISATKKRSDEESLSFYQSYEKVLKLAAHPTENSWKIAKANMTTLHRDLNFSPDLIPQQAKELSEQFVEKMIQIRKDVKKIEFLGKNDNEEDISDFETSLDKSAEILDL